MTPLVAMSLDIAKNRTGYAVGSTAWPRPFWGVHERSGPWDRREGERLNEWRRFLVGKLDEHGITYVTVEQLFINMGDFNFNGTVPIAQMHGIVLQLCQERGIKCGEAPIGAWRKRFLGTAAAPKGLAGKAKTEWWKRQAITACVARNWYVTHHDEAEAIGILDFTLASLDRDYAHRTAPLFRRRELQQDVARFQGVGA